MRECPDCKKLKHRPSFYDNFDTPCRLCTETAQRKSGELFMKHCSSCDKPKNKFKDYSEGGNGLMKGVCRVCVSINADEWKKENKKPKPKPKPKPRKKRVTKPKSEHTKRKDRLHMTNTERIKYNRIEFLKKFDLQQEQILKEMK